MPSDVSGLRVPHVLSGTSDAYVPGLLHVFNKTTQAAYSAWCPLSPHVMGAVVISKAAQGGWHVVADSPPLIAPLPYWVAALQFGERTLAPGLGPDWPKPNTQELCNSFPHIPHRIHQHSCRLDLLAGSGIPPFPTTLTAPWDEPCVSTWDTYMGFCAFLPSHLAHVQSHQVWSPCSSTCPALP